tara:strand:- start:664 stop:1515 length:852 start_codon:yes stop_codon:yes gene_type:complete
MLNDLIKTAYARGGSSSEKITSLGRRAAQRFIDSDDRNLTQAVTSVISEEGDLSRDQIQRVAESANQQAWKSLFVEGGGDAGVHFEPADASDVLEEVAPSAPEIREINTDYDSPPPAGDMERLLSAFDSESTEPDALNPAAKEEAAHEKVSHARDFAQSAADSAFSQLAERADKVYDLIKTACAEDQPFFTICKAVSHASHDQDWAADVLKITASRLEADGIQVNMEKSAGVLVFDDEHPLIQEIREFEKLAMAYARSASVHLELEDQSKKTLGYIRDKLRGV